MKDFLTRHSYLVIWITALIFFGAAAYAIFYFNGYVPPIPIPGLAGLAAAPRASITPATTNVTFTIQKSANGNSFFVQWQNLPSGTTMLAIFRGKTGTPQDTWSLWQTVTIAPGDLAGGNSSFALGAADESGYSFYAEAENNSGGGSGGSTGNGAGGNGGSPLWTSSSTVPVVTTPPSSSGSLGGSPNNPPENPSSTNGNPPPPSNPSSSNPVSGNNPPSSPPPTPTGTPYYNPQVQISGYGSAPGTFWVQHADQSIEIGWQNLPAGITAITVACSASSTGPWSTIVNQQNPGASGSYSLQIIDDTVNDPYYYEMTAFNGTTTAATYGPEYLAPQ